MCNYWLIGIAHVCNRVGAAMINLRRHPLLLRMPNRWWSCCCCISALCQLLTYTKEQLGLGIGGRLFANAILPPSALHLILHRAEKWNFHGHTNMWGKRERDEVPPRVASSDAPYMRKGQQHIVGERESTRTFQLVITWLGDSWRPSVSRRGCFSLPPRPAFLPWPPQQSYSTTTVDYYFSLSVCVRRVVVAVWLYSSTPLGANHGCHRKN
jgi:hypothetical protein